MKTVPRYITVFFVMTFAAIISLHAQEKPLLDDRLQAKPESVSASTIEGVELKLTMASDIPNLSIAESIDEKGRTSILILRNGAVVDSIEIPDSSSEQTLENKKDEESFKKIRRDVLLETYDTIQSLTPETILASSDLNTTISVEIPSTDSNATVLKKNFLSRAKGYVWDPMIHAFYTMTADQKKTILANHEYGLSFHAQISPAVIVNRFGFGFLFGLGLDVGYNRELRKIMISFYEIHGKSSGGLALDATVGTGFGAYFRSKNPDLNSQIEAKGFLTKMLGLTSKSESRKGNYANIGVVMFSSVYEASLNYASVQGQLTLSINPIPSALQIQSTANAWNVGFFTPRVLFSKVGHTLGAKMQNFWSFIKERTKGLQTNINANQILRLSCQNVL
jgi:hypothetical protein